jgi:2-aminoethylphosphonate-pyruvate transaminase
VPNDPAALDQALADDPTITHVAAVHCETTSGILNPIEQIAAVSARHGRGLIIDAMSALGAIELDARKVVFDAVAASSNKCLEGVPGMGFAIIRRDALQRCQGNAPSLSLDLYDQWVSMEANGQWRFTPPTHVIVAFHQALDEHAAEGGVAGRGARYRHNGCVAGTDYRHLPHAGRPQVRFQAFLRPAERARLRDLSGQADGGGQLSHRLYRSPG